MTDKTCTISTPGGKDFAVTLPTVSKNTLATAGAVAGRTPFAINLTKCSATSPPTSSRVRPSTSTAAAWSTRPRPTLPPTCSCSCWARTTSSCRSGCRAGLAQTNSQWVTVGTDGSADLNYYAEYYATAAATPGDVTSSVKYTIIYN